MAQPSEKLSGGEGVEGKGGSWLYPKLQRRVPIEGGHSSVDGVPSGSRRPAPRPLVGAATLMITKEYRESSRPYSTAPQA